MTSSNSPADSPDAQSRSHRAVIAAQACQTCRSRKSKCDERRPKCSLCIRLNAPCEYREPQPTKKDKTLTYILQALERVESKVDRIASPSASSTEAKSASTSNGFIAHGHDREDGHDGTATVGTALRTSSPDQGPLDGSPSSDTTSVPGHMTAAHRILMWPAVYLLLTTAQTPVAADLNAILHEGSPWFARLDFRKHTLTLPTHNDHGSKVNPLAAMAHDSIKRLTDAYFDTFNAIQPILDRDSFQNEIIAPLTRPDITDSRTQDDTTMCLALMVLALGQLAIEGATGDPISYNSSSRSGIRGGSLSDPPGLGLFNEARRRFSFILHTCTLENVQLYLLQAAYYEASFRHTDFWRACAAASTACQIFIRCHKIDWSDSRWDLVKRVFWVCMMHEDLYHLELDLPATGIYTLEDQVPLPTFPADQALSGSGSDPTSISHYHFLSIVTLRRLLSRIHSSLHADTKSRAENSQAYGNPPIHLIKELGRQLEAWREYLPQQLQWSDQDMHAQPVVNPLARHQPGPLFTPEDGGNPIGRRNFSAIVTGHLRTRFYHARYLIYRPFIFKALHFPESMTEEDAAYCALAIRSTCLWPISMYPCRDMKRSVPYLFAWSQNFVGILIILRMCFENDYLRKICDDRVNQKELKQTVRLNLDWLRDVQSMDGLAEWGLRLLEPLWLTSNHEH